NRGRLETALGLNEDHVASLDLLDRFFGQDDPAFLASARRNAHAHGLTLGKPAGSAIELQYDSRGSTLRVKRWRDRSDDGIDATAVGQLHLRRIAGPDPLRVAGRHRGIDLDLARIGYIEQLRTRRDISAQLSIDLCDPATDRASDCQVAAPAHDTRRTDGSIGTLQIGLGRLPRGNGRFQVLTSGYFGVDQSLLPRRSGSGSLRSRRGRISLRNEGGGLATFEQSDGLAGAHWIAQPPIDANDRAIRARRKQCLALWRRCHGRLSENLACQRSGFNFLDCDAGGSHFLGGHRDEAFGSVLLLGFRGRLFGRCRLVGH
ncbi:MAG: hypothetical protein Q8K85_05290, partial [Hyphomicrobium sp.]|nr:hypothetical protein [Hyphomicrobium sp.]